MQGQRERTPKNQNRNNTLDGPPGLCPPPHIAMRVILHQCAHCDQRVDLSLAAMRKLPSSCETPSLPHGIEFRIQDVFCRTFGQSHVCSNTHWPRWPRTARVHHQWVVETHASLTQSILRGLFNLIAQAECGMRVCLFMQDRLGSVCRSIRFALVRCVQRGFAVGSGGVSLLPCP